MNPTEVVQWAFEHLHEKLMPRLQNDWESQYVFEILDQVEQAVLKQAENWAEVVDLPPEIDGNAPDLVYGECRRRKPYEADGL